jgi:predicted transcriptional regulator
MDEQLRVLVKQGLTQTAIAEKLGVNQTTVGRRLKKLGLQVYVRPLLDKETAEKNNKESKRRHYESNKATILLRNKGVVKHCRSLLNTIKEAPCMDCGGKYPPYVMDFDHRDPSQKMGEVTRLVSSGEKRVLEEVAKCDVVCANCHRERTHSRL